MNAPANGRHRRQVTPRGHLPGVVPQVGAAEALVQFASMPDAELADFIMAMAGLADESGFADAGCALREVAHRLMMRPDPDGAA